MLNIDELNKEIERMQVQMYELGKVDCIKSLKEAFSAYEEKNFYKANVIGLLDTILEAMVKK